ncbi:hypothetical protein WJX75_008669 [Coccomyxa subellipsoidea]|uniref:Uncharacterized protein n=1 Tax=Coccomyxa subellipsoidea TaxID=248742 RepID=A0ABR2YQJ8_9CHLO
MEEEKAHNLYALFSSVDAGARQKRGLGFSTGVQGTSNRQSGDALTDDQSRKQDSAAKPEQLNFRELISGYDQMSAGERMKARTKLLLERTDKTGKDDRQQWTRFVFNKDALLDEEGAQPDNAFGGGANAVSLKVPAAQARQNERILSAQEAHEAAIFGLPAAGPQSSPPVIGQHAGLGARPPSPEPPEQLSPDPPIHAETVQNQAAVSWRERAAQLRAQRQAT